MSQRGIGTTEAEMRGNFTERGGPTLGVLFFLNEIQNLPLSPGQPFHTEQMSSISDWVSRNIFIELWLDWCF